MSTRSSRRIAGSVALALTLFAAPACTGPSGSTKEFCDEVAKVPALESVLARFSEADPQVLQDRIDRAREAYDDLAEAAPDDIDDETDAVVELVDATLAAVEAHPTDPAAAADQLRTVMAQHAKVDRARAKVTEYAQSECDIRLDPTLSSSTDESTTTIAGTTTTGATTSTTSG